MAGEPMLSRTRWLEQKYRAHNRSIEFLLTYEQWHDWWSAELAKREADARRGRKGGNWQMLRIGDQGPYALGNIYCGTHLDNGADRRRFSRWGDEELAAEVAKVRAKLVEVMIDAALSDG